MVFEIVESFLNLSESVLETGRIFGYILKSFEIFQNTFEIL